MAFFCGLVLLMASSIALPQGMAQQPPATPPAQQEPQQKPQPSVDPVTLPVDLDRIQRALANTPKLRFDPQTNRPVFRVQVFGEKPSIDDILGPNWAKGPVPYSGMSHQEFLAMVTPEEHKGYAGFTNKEGMTIAATSYLLQWTLQKAIRKFNETQDEREREAARREVIDALNALEQARAKAGLPKK
jgi:hypothetical protein